MNSLKKLLSSFSSWYERHYTFNVGLASFLFIWQLAHLYWLTTDVVFLKLFGVSLFNLQGIWQYLIIVVDYTEIPALVTTSLIYIHELTRSHIKTSNVIPAKAVPDLVGDRIPSQAGNDGSEIGSKRFSWKSVWFLIFINSQWLHLFWITDEFVIEQLTGVGTNILPIWLAWFAIFIDYLEVPVILDTLKKFFRSLRK